MSNTVPSGWGVHELGDLALKIEGGGTPPRNEPRYWGGDIPWASVKDLRGVELNSTKESISEMGLENSSSKLIPANTLIIACRMAVGKAVFFNRDVAINQDLKAFFTRDNVNWRFLLHWYLAKSEQINDLATGSTVKGIRLDDLNLLPIDLPPLPEQQKIAAILSTVDDVIEKTRAQIAKLKDLKIGMMQELLTKGIGHTEFKDSPVGRIPVGWDVRNLEKITVRIIDCEHKTAPYVDKSEYLVVRTSNVRHGELIHDGMKFTTEGGYAEWTKRAVPSVGDVLFSREAPAGESCMVPSGIKVCMGQRMVLLSPNAGVVFPDYFSLFLSSEIARLAIYGLSIGTTVTRINIEDIKRIPCVIPPVVEQKEIFTAVQSVQTSILSKKSRLNSLKSVKKALMQELLTGNVRVKVDH
ncbi:restriction endonuclease subunit S [Zhongshania borealis]|uniref:Type I restriction modification DNA specificity domain-containing protein n=1 Tax=Zhongshania borealis TaxID=889488 RepID=A0ABP7X715_9GAMM